MPEHPPLALLRHGASTSAADGLFCGVPDVPPTDRARRAAEAFVEWQLARGSRLHALSADTPAGPAAAAPFREQPIEAIMPAGQPSVDDIGPLTPPISGSGRSLDPAPADRAAIPLAHEGGTR